MQQLTFSVVGRERPPITAKIHDPARVSIGAVAAKAAARHGLTGTCEILNPVDGNLIEPRTPLDQLQDLREVVLAPDLTPATG